MTPRYSLRELHVQGRYIVNLLRLTHNKFFDVCDINSPCSPFTKPQRIWPLSTPTKSSCKETSHNMQAPSGTSASPLELGPMSNPTQLLPGSAEAKDTERGGSTFYPNRVSELTSNSDIESLQPFPSHFPDHPSQPSRWDCFRCRNFRRVLISVLCFIAAIAGTVGGSYFVADVIRRQIFGEHHAQNVTTVRVTETKIIVGGHLATETMWITQNTVLSTAWARATATSS